MAQTARFVRESGAHSELVLRVRQANNPNFAFLWPHDRRHSYFRWLLDAGTSQVRRLLFCELCRLVLATRQEGHFPPRYIMLPGC